MSELIKQYALVIIKVKQVSIVLQEWKCNQEKNLIMTFPIQDKLKENTPTTNKKQQPTTTTSYFDGFKIFIVFVSLQIEGILQYKCWQ